MENEEYDRAASFWKEKDKTSTHMKKEELLKRIEDFIRKNNTLALATGSGENIRCTPLEYGYHDGAFYIFSEGGLKFRGLKENEYAAAAIYHSYGSFGQLNSLQITGKAEIITLFSDEYKAAAKAKGIPFSALEKLESPMYLIKIIPVRYDYLCSDLKKEGYASRQSLDL